jgi:hypothetical protein
MRGIFKFLEGVIVFYLAYVFIKWYIKGHFSKYFIFFWLNTIIAIIMFVYNKQYEADRYQNGWMVE